MFGKVMIVRLPCDWDSDQPLFLWLSICTQAALHRSSTAQTLPQDTTVRHATAGAARAPAPLAGARPGAGSRRLWLCWPSGRCW